jgi:FkbM family methyltransferase
MKSGPVRAAKRQVRRWAESAVERLLRVQVYPVAPFGVDPYASLVDLMDWAPGHVVFDVGANEGRAAVRLNRHLPTPTVYAFEPVGSTFRKLCARAEHLPDVRPLNLALGAEPGRRTIYLHEKDIMNSFSPTWSEPVGTEEVEVETLDRVVERQGIDFVHFLKIDTEGHELEVLEGARGALAARRIGIILLEVGMDPRVSPHTSLEGVRCHLAPFGYVLHGVFNQSRKRTGAPREWSGTVRGYRPTAMKYCDAMFICVSLDAVDHRA